MRTPGQVRRRRIRPAFRAVLVGSVLAGTVLVGTVLPASAISCKPHCPVPLPDPVVYVANNGSDTVSVIDASTDTVTGSVGVGSGPTGVAVNPVGGAVYVTNTDSDSVSVIDGSTDVVSATIPLGHGAAPSGVAVTPDGATAYVADSGTNKVSVIDTSTNAVSATVPVGSDPSAVTVGPRGASVYVTNHLSRSVSVIKTSSNSVVATVTVGYFPSAVTSSPLGTDVYVTNECGANKYCDRPGTLSVIDSATFKVTATYQVGYAPVAVTMTPNAQTLYVVNSCGPAITPPPKTLPGPDCADTNGKDPANVTTFGATAMVVDFDPTIGNAQPGLVEGAATSPDGTSMFVANSCGSDPSCGSSGTVSVFNTNVGTSAKTTLTVGDDPLGVAFGGPWVPEQQQPSITTDVGPAVATVGAYLYAAETVSGTVMYEYYDTAAGGWTSPAAIPGASSTYAPALTAVGSTLWAAWTTSSATIQYNELNTSTGNWAAAAGRTPTVPQAGTNAGPALANLEGVVYVAWKGTNVGDIYYTSDNGSWASQETVPSAVSNGSPVIAALPGSSVLYFAWKDKTTDDLYLDDYLGSGFGTPVEQPQAQSDWGPALAVTPSGVYLMWKDASTGMLGYSIAVAGGWTIEQFVPYALTGAKPALAALGSNLYLAIQGKGDTDFWYDALN